VCISAAAVLTAARYVATALGIAVPASAFLQAYQSVDCSLECASADILSLCIFVKPIVFTVFVSAPVGALPASISDCVYFVSAISLAVAAAYVRVTLSPLESYANVPSSFI